jgi:RNA-directed DNA polymerase
MSDLPLKKYRSRSPDNPYLEGFGTTSESQPEKPISQTIWMGNAENVTWRELKEKIKAERGAKCECCGALGKRDLHHIKPRKSKGLDTEDNLQLLCRPCHAQTPSFGRR